MSRQRARAVTDDAAPAEDASAAGRQRRELHFETFDEVIADVRQLELGYERLGNWSLVQTCDHLALFMRLSLEGFPRRLVPWPLSTLMRRVLLSPRRIVRPMPPGLRTPRYLVPAPPPHGSDARAADHAAAARLVGMCRRVKHHGGEFYPSPIFGKLPPALWRLVHLRHCELHLGFLAPGVAWQRQRAGRRGK